jgi:hypothetical protein
MIAYTIIEIIGSVLLMVGLVLIILAAHNDKSIWWWVVGGALFVTGLEVMIDAKIDKAKKTFFRGTDDSYYP